MNDVHKVKPLLPTTIILKVCKYLKIGFFRLYKLFLKYLFVEAYPRSLHKKIIFFETVT